MFLFCPVIYIESIVEDRWRCGSRELFHLDFVAGRASRACRFIPRCEGKPSVPCRCDAAPRVAKNALGYERADNVLRVKAGKENDRMNSLTH
uniref:Predicted protein n=1 Tax=Hordeum vulgare subsp. vulgare TaxID=112509 RepID=F2CV14_HORVV|nr:predicted protein [Hordeum vulgare subsp. vulgare]